MEISAESSKERCGWGCFIDDNDDNDDNDMT
jgi:hypothetical protein